MKTFSFDIETIPGIVPEEIINYRKTSVISRMRKGTVKEKALLKALQNKDVVLLEIADKVRIEVIEEYHEKLTQVSVGNALDKRFCETIAFSFHNGDESFSFVNTSEQLILENLIEYMLNEDMRRLVTWNGERFDLPVIKFRSIIHKKLGLVKAFENKEHKDIFWTFNNPYSRMEEKIGFGENGWINLHQACLLLNIPHNLHVKSKNMAKLVEIDDLETIKAICESDAVATWELWNRTFI